jgi:hypothetical protein
MKHAQDGRRKWTILGAVGLAALTGCATRAKPAPTTAAGAMAPELVRAFADSSARMAIELMDRQMARKEAQAIRLTPEVLQLLARFAADRQRTGAWPDAAGLALPPGVSELRSGEDAGALRIEIRGACPLAARLLPEGTLVVYPPSPTNAARSESGAGKGGAEPAAR